MARSSLAAAVIASAHARLPHEREGAVQFRAHAAAMETMFADEEHETLRVSIWLHPHRLSMLEQYARTQLIDRLLIEGLGVLEEYGVAALTGAVEHNAETSEVALVYLVNAEAAPALEHLAEDLAESMRRH